mmetsp:Transcript_69592/g.225209  ORF Transcript_69592/g.225209 Transcript_69592/m.225209 type:complete len:305 (-) Transcript_69592:84-998(-)
MEVDGDGARWSQDGGDVVWCESAEELLAAVAAGNLKVEVGGGVKDGYTVVQAVIRTARQLQSLSLCGCNIDGIGLLQIGQALASSHIQGVGVSNNPGIDMETWASFWGLLPPSVVKWDFGDDELPDSALQPLVHAMGRGEVHELFLDGNGLTDIAPLLPLLPAARGLTELDVGDNDIGDAQILALVAALPGSSLNTLVLGRNPVTDASAVPLAAVLPRTRISILHLDCTRIGNATLDALVAVLASTELEELHIDQTRVKDDGVLRFLRVLPASKLSILDAEDNNLSEETAAALAAALPGSACME